MKNKVFIKATLLLVMFMCLPLMACAQTRLLTNFPSGQDIEKTYISKYMIEKNKDYLYDNYGSSKIAVKGLDDLNLENLTGIEMYNSKNLDAVMAIGMAIKKMLEEYKANPLIMTEEGILISGIFILRQYNESIGVAIIDSNNVEIDITILHGKVY